MARKRKTVNEKGALELLEEAFHLLRHAPAAVWLAYLTGALPFTLGLLLFWSEMSQSGYAWRYHSVAALGLALLFFWLKCWQTVFCQSLLIRVTGRAAEAWNLRRVLRMIAQQASWQSTGLFLVPLAGLALVPFGMVFAFYQSLTVMGDGRTSDRQDPVPAAWGCAKAWPGQNHALLGCLAAWGLVVLVNWISAFVLAPQVLKSFLGIETLFSRSHDTYLNSTFLAAMVLLTWATVDPLVKAVYTLRCFHATARATGEDLKAILRRAQAASATTVLLLGLLVAAGAAQGAAATQGETVTTPAPAVVSPAELDKAIQLELDQRKYTWRIPKEKLPPPPSAEKAGFVRGFFQELGKTLEGWMNGVGDALERFAKWVGNLFPKNLNPPAVKPTPRRPTGDFQTDWLSPLRVLLVLLLVAIVAVIVVFLFRLWKRRRRRHETAEVTPELPAAKPDLNSEHVAANELPEDEWLQMARDLIGRGELRLALRAYYLSCLACLGERKLVAIAKSKSNRDYERELARRAHSLPGLTELFHDHVVVFERVWYGLHEVTGEMLREYEAKLQRLRAL